MNEKPELAKKKIESILTNMAENHWLFTNDPGHAFMRQNLGKLDFYNTMRMLLCMGKETTTNEIINYL